MKIFEINLINSYPNPTNSPPINSPSNELTLQPTHPPTNSLQLQQTHSPPTPTNSITFNSNKLTPTPTNSLNSTPTNSNSNELTQLNSNKLQLTQPQQTHSIQLQQIHSAPQNSLQLDKLTHSTHFNLFNSNTLQHTAQCTSTICMFIDCFYKTVFICICVLHRNMWPGSNRGIGNVFFQNNICCVCCYMRNII